MKFKYLYFLIFFIPSLCLGAFTDGNQLKAQCTNSESPANQGLCLGYVMGVTDVNLRDKICTPSGVTIGQLQSITIKYLNDYPDRLHYSADSLVLDALRKAFPCKGKK